MDMTAQPWQRRGGFVAKPRQSMNSNLASG
jgi:hypothetical protein